jgi:hypothetical protein
MAVGRTSLVVWLNFAGHLRSFTRKLPNFESFVNAHPCVFVSLFTGAQSKLQDQHGGPNTGSAGSQASVVGILQDAGNFELKNKFYCG